nr:MAG TPA: hypothetical protein [Caudoviricetes sp.]
MSSPSGHRKSLSYTYSIYYILTSISRYIGVNKEAMQVQLLLVGRGSVTGVGSTPIFAAVYQIPKRTLQLK